MQLHQFLRYIHCAVPIMIFNLKDVCICSVRDKSSINIDLYEYVILDINIGPSNLKGCNSAIYITLEK